MVKAAKKGNATAKSARSKDTTETKTKDAKVAKAAISKKRKNPKTTKDKIISILEDSEEKFVGLPTIKKKLLEMGCSDGGAFKKNVSKALLALEQADIIYKWGASYAMQNSAAVLKMQSDAQAEAEIQEKLDQDLVDCPWCGHWNDQDAFQGEDSIARGGIHRCQQTSCGKTFYTHISDGYKRGHEREYKYSKDYTL